MTLCNNGCGASLWSSTTTYVRRQHTSPAADFHVLFGCSELLIRIKLSPYQGKLVGKAVHYYKCKASIYFTRCWFSDALWPLWTPDQLASVLFRSGQPMPTPNLFPCAGEFIGKVVGLEFGMEERTETSPWYYILTLQLLFTFNENFYGRYLLANVWTKFILSLIFKGKKPLSLSSQFSLPESFRVSNKLHCFFSMLV